MASGSIELTSPKAWKGRIDWNSTAYENGNYSIVNAYVYTWKTDGYKTSGGGWFNGSVSIGGSSQDISYEQQEKNEQYVGSIEGIRVNHNSDGTGSVAIACSITKGPGTSLAGVTISGSETVTLDTNIVGGASTAIWRSKPVVLDVENTIEITRDNYNFTHELEMKLGGTTYPLASHVGASCTVTIPVSYASYITDSERRSCELICKTYNGNHYIGQSKTTFELVVPASVVPSVSISVSDSTGLLDEFGAYIQTQSQAKVKITTTPAYGARITGTETTCGLMVSYDAYGPVFDLPQSGQIEIKTTVKDARGHTQTASATLTVKEYALPLSQITSVYRCNSVGNEDPQGEYAMITFNGMVDGLTYTTAKYQVQYRVQGEAYWTTISLPQYDGRQEIRDVQQIITAEKTVAYEISIKVSDRFTSGRESAYRICPPAFVMLDIDKTTQSFGFGQPASEPGRILLGMPLRINKGILPPEYHIDHVDEAPALFDSILQQLPHDNMIHFFALNMGGGKYIGMMMKMDFTQAHVVLYYCDTLWRITKKGEKWSKWIAQ